MKTKNWDTVKKGLHLLSKSKPRERRELLTKCKSDVIKDIKYISKCACVNKNLQKHKKLKKLIPYKHLFRKIANSKKISDIRNILVNKSGSQRGGGLFTLLGGILVPLIISAITEGAP